VYRGAAKRAERNPPCQTGLWIYCTSKS
jgi:hypothetical protein